MVAMDVVHIGSWGKVEDDYLTPVEPFAGVVYNPVSLYCLWFCA